MTHKLLTKIKKFVHLPLLIILSAGGFLFCASDALGAPRGEVFDFVRSSLSDDTYLVTIEKAGNATIGCGAVSKKSKTLTVFTVLASGDGTLSVVAPFFGLKPMGQTMDVPVSIGKVSSSELGGVDGNVITVALSGTQIAAADETGISINGVPYELAEFKKLHELASKCLRNEIGK